MAWKSIDPRAGNERLEHLVHAFPVSSHSDLPLTIIGGQALGLRSTRLKRDQYGLYNNDEMKGIRTLSSWITMGLVTISTLIFLLLSALAGIGLYGLTAVLHCCLELLAGTMYLEREGWAFLEEVQLGNELEKKLGDLDHNLRTLRHWGSFSFRSVY